MKRPSSLSLLWHQARYEWRIFWRTPISAFFTIFFPLLIFVVFSLAFGNETIDYLGITTAQFYAPSLAVFSAVSATYTNISITTAYQRDEGILKRVRGTPLPPWIFFGGKILSSILIALIGTLIMIDAGILFFGLQVYVETIPILIVTFFIGVATFAALGLLVAALAPTGQAATAIANATLLPLAFVSGVFIIPGEDMPSWLTAVSDFFPLSHFAAPFVAAFTPEVSRPPFEWTDLAYLALWGIVAMALAIRWFRWEPSSGGGGRRSRNRTEHASS
ncbi:MAG: ABC transporter permease [Acidimicrobiia bacterium]